MPDHRQRRRAVEADVDERRAGRHALSSGAMRGRHAPALLRARRLSYLRRRSTVERPRNGACYGESLGLSARAGRELGSRNLRTKGHSCSVAG